MAGPWVLHTMYRLTEITFDKKVMQIADTNFEAKSHGLQL